MKNVMKTCKVKSNEIVLFPVGTHAMSLCVHLNHVYLIIIMFNGLALNLFIFKMHAVKNEKSPMAMLIVCFWTCTMSSLLWNTMQIQL